MNSEEKNSYQSNGNVIDIEGTPFKIVETEYAKLLVMGRDVLKMGKTEIELRTYVEEKPWELILNAAAIYNKYITNKIEEEAK